MPDEFGRPLLSDAIKQSVADAFKAVPDDKRGALLVIADEHGTRGVLAAKINDHWKVAASGGFEWGEKKPSGYVAIEGSW